MSLLPRLSLSAALFAACAAQAAPPEPLASHVGAWKPLAPRNLNPKSGLYFGHSKEQVGKMTANMLAYMEGVRKMSPFISQPRGFDFTVYGTICEYLCMKGQPIAGETSMIVHEYTIKAGGKPRRVDEGPSFRFHFNDIRRLLTTTGMDDTDELYFVEPKIVEHVAGHPVYEGGLLLLTKRDRPVFKYVSNERGMSDEMKNLETMIANKRKQIPTETNPRQVAYLERIAQRDQASVDKLRARLAAMTPEQRQAPYQDVAGQRFVTISRDFYDKSLPPSALQLVIVDMYKFGPRFKDTHSPHTVEAVKILQQQLDPQQLLDMLE